MLKFLIKEFPILFYQLIWIVGCVLSTATQKSPFWCSSWLTRFTVKSRAFLFRFWFWCWFFGYFSDSRTLNGYQFISLFTGVNAHSNTHTHTRIRARTIVLRQCSFRLCSTICYYTWCTFRNLLNFFFLPAIIIIIMIIVDMFWFEGKITRISLFSFCFGEMNGRQMDQRWSFLFRCVCLFDGWLDGGSAYARSECVSSRLSNRLTMWCFFRCYNYSAIFLVTNNWAM